MSRRGRGRAWFTRLAGAGLTLLALLGGRAAPPAAAAGPTLDDFFPLVTRRPALEQEIEARVEHAKGPAGRRTAGMLALDLLPLPRWQVAVALPATLVTRPGPVRGGVGDLELETKVLLLQDERRGALVTGGLAASLPTGSAARGLGGEATLTPFLSAGLTPGPLFVVAAVAYAWQLQSPLPGPRAEELQTSLAVGVPMGRRLIPFLELSAAGKLRGTDAAEGPPLRGRAQLALTPGLNVQLRPEATLGLGLRVPLTAARTADYTLFLSLDWEF